MMPLGLFSKIDTAVHHNIYFHDDFIDFQLLKFFENKTKPKKHVFALHFHVFFPPVCPVKVQDFRFYFSY